MSQCVAFSSLDVLLLDQLIIFEFLVALYRLTNEVRIGELLVQGLIHFNVLVLPLIEVVPVVEELLTISLMSIQPKGLCLLSLMAQLRFMIMSIMMMLAHLRHGGINVYSQ